MSHNKAILRNSVYCHLVCKNTQYVATLTLQKTKSVSRAVTRNAALYAESYISYEDELNAY